MCQSMVNIQSPTAEIRRGKKEREEEDRKKPQGKHIIPKTEYFHTIDILKSAAVNPKSKTRNEY